MAWPYQMSFGSTDRYDYPDRAKKMQALVADLPDVPAAAKKPGFFKKGGNFWNVLGYVGDSLAGNTAYGDQVSAQLKEQLAARREQQKLENDIYLKQLEVQLQSQQPTALRKNVEWMQGLPTTGTPGLAPGALTRGGAMSIARSINPTPYIPPQPMQVEEGSKFVGGQPGPNAVPDVVDDRGNRMRWNPTIGDWEPVY